MYSVYSVWWYIIIYVISHALIFLSTDAHGVHILSAYSSGLYVVYDRCRVALLLLAEYVSMGVSLPRMVVFVTIYSNRCPILICLLVFREQPLCTLGATRTAMSA